MLSPAKRKLTPPGETRVTRSCLRAQIHAVVLSEDILSALFAWLGTHHLKCAAAVCRAWRDAARLSLHQSRRNRGIYAVGGCFGGAHPSSSLSLATVQRYDPSRGEWNTMAELKQARDHLGLASTGGQIYAVGGWTGTRNCATVEVYDPQADRWQPAPSLCTERSGLGVTVSGSGVMVAVGGWGGEGLDYLASVEAFDVHKGRWELLAELQAPRHCPGVASLEQWLYVSGGLPGHALSRLSSVERLDLSARDAAWEPVAPMLMPRYRHALAALRGQLYAVGGETATAENGALVVTASVERYDPEARQWTAVAPLCHARMSHAVTVLDGGLLALGGFDGASWLSSAERYDPSTDSWEVFAVPGFLPRCAQGLTVC